MCILKETITRHFSSGQRKLLLPFLQVPVCSSDLGYLEDSMGRYLFRGGLMGIATSYIFQNGSRTVPCGSVVMWLCERSGCMRMRTSSRDDGLNGWGSP